MSKPNDREIKIIADAIHEGAIAKAGEAGWAEHCAELILERLPRLALRPSRDAIERAHAEGMECQCPEGPRPETGGDAYGVGTPRQFAERLAWMTVNGKPDLGQWENHIKHRDATLLGLHGQAKGGVGSDAPVTNISLGIALEYATNKNKTEWLFDREQIADLVAEISHLAQKAALLASQSQAKAETGGDARYMIVLHNYWMDSISFEQIPAKATNAKDAEREAAALRSDREKQFNQCAYTVVSLLASQGQARCGYDMGGECAVDQDKASQGLGDAEYPERSKDIEVVRLALETGYGRMWYLSRFDRAREALSRIEAHPQPATGIREALEAMKKAELLLSTVELNMGNYSDDDVRTLNAAAIEAWSVLNQARAALAEREGK